MIGNENSLIVGTPKMYRQTIIISVVTDVLIVRVSVSLMLVSAISARVKRLVPITLRLSLTRSNTTIVLLMEYPIIVRHAAMNALLIWICRIHMMAIMMPTSWISMITALIPL